LQFTIDFYSIFACLPIYYKNKTYLSRDKKEKNSKYEEIFSKKSKLKKQNPGSLGRQGFWGLPS